MELDPIQRKSLKCSWSEKCYVHNWKHLLPNQGRATDLHKWAAWCWKQIQTNETTHTKAMRKQSTDSSWKVRRRFLQTLWSSYIWDTAGTWKSWDLSVYIDPQMINQPSAPWSPTALKLKAIWKGLKTANAKGQIRYTQSNWNTRSRRGCWNISCCWLDWFRHESKRWPRGRWQQ